MPASVSSSAHTSIFEAILEECSAKEIDVELNNEEDLEVTTKKPEIFPEHPLESQHIWGMMD